MSTLLFTPRPLTVKNTVGPLGVTTKANPSIASPGLAMLAGSCQTRNLNVAGGQVSNQRSGTARRIARSGKPNHLVVRFHTVTVVVDELSRSAADIPWEKSEVVLKINVCDDIELAEHGSGQIRHVDETSRREPVHDDAPGYARSERRRPGSEHGRTAVELIDGTQRLIHEVDAPGR